VAAGALSEEASLLVAVAAHDQEPVGVAVVDPTQSPALLRALAVAPAHRGQGLGTDLLHSIEQLCRQAGANRISAEYRDDLTERGPLERVFEKRGWSAPEARRHLCKALVADVVGHPGLDRGDPPGEAAFAPWPEVTDAERRYMQTQVQTGALPAACSPLQMPDAVEPACSLVLRGDDGLQGWIVAHRLGGEVVQYTSLYVDQRKRRDGRGLALVTEAAHRQHEQTEAEKALWTIRTDNEPMVAFLHEHLAPMLASHDKQWATHQSLS
jgi:GNAT superfamily N-acetyltransferase